MQDAPQFKYLIRVGSKTLYSTDIMDLKLQFYRHISKLKRKFTATKKRRVYAH